MNPVRSAVHARAPRFAATGRPHLFPVPYRCVALASAHKSPGTHAFRAPQSQSNSPFFPSPLHHHHHPPPPTTTTPFTSNASVNHPYYYDHDDVSLSPNRLLGLIVRDDPTSVGEYTGEYIAKRYVRGCGPPNFAFMHLSFDPRKLP